MCTVTERKTHFATYRSCPTPLEDLLRRMLLHCSDPWSNLPSFANHIPAIASPCQVKPRTLQVPEAGTISHGDRWCAPTIIQYYDYNLYHQELFPSPLDAQHQTPKPLHWCWPGLDILPAASGASTVPYPASRRAAWPSWPKAKVPRGRDAIQRAREPWIQRAIARQNHRDSMCICGCFIFVCVYVYLSLCACVLKRYALHMHVCVLYFMIYTLIYIYIYIY